MSETTGKRRFKIERLEARIAPGSLKNCFRGFSGCRGGSGHKPKGGTSACRPKGGSSGGKGKGGSSGRKGGSSCKKFKGGSSGRKHKGGTSACRRKAPVPCHVPKNHPCY